MRDLEENQSCRSVKAWPKRGRGMPSGNHAVRAELARMVSRCPTIGSPQISAKVSVTMKSRVDEDIRRINYYS